MSWISKLVIYWFFDFNINDLIVVNYFLLLYFADTFAKHKHHSNINMLISQAHNQLSLVMIKYIHIHVVINLPWLQNTYTSFL